LRREGFAHFKRIFRAKALVAQRKTQSLSLRKSASDKNKKVSATGFNWLSYVMRNLTCQGVLHNDYRTRLEVTASDPLTWSDTFFLDAILIKGLALSEYVADVFQAERSYFFKVVPLGNR
jgi:hypothetical protein